MSADPAILEQLKGIPRGRLGAVYAEILCRSFTMPLLLNIVNAGQAEWVRKSIRVDQVGLTRREYAHIWDEVAAYTHRILAHRDKQLTADLAVKAHDAAVAAADKADG